MFSSGDEMILAACKEMAETDDSQPVEVVLLREYDIFVRNAAFREEEATAEVNAADVFEDEDGDYPDCLLTAVAMLVENDQLTEDAAAGLMASYAKATATGQLLRDAYDHFIEFGNTEDFIDMVRG